MNKVIVQGNAVIKNFEKGDLFKSNLDEIFILCQSSSTDFVAICLKDGVRWVNASKDVNTAVEGLTFIGRSATIRVDF
jgi:hypothetical protein